MVEEMLSVTDLIERLGFPAASFILIYAMLRLEQKKKNEQMDGVLEFSKNVVSANTEALTHMYHALIEHTEKKEKFIEVIGHCAEDRDERLRRIETRVEGMKTELHSGLYDLTKIAEDIKLQTTK